MSCKKFGIMLSAHLDGELDAKSSEELMNHLKSCGRCINELERLGQMKNMFGLRNPHKAPDFFETRLAARIREYEGYPFWRKHPAVLRSILPAALSLCLLVLVVTNVKKIIPGAGGTRLSAVLSNEAAETVFENELMDIYYGPVNGQGGK
jgi:anti-sigma factor RsiW